MTNSRIPGARKPELKAIPTVKERISFLYVEHCLINRQDSAIAVTDARGTVCVPAASLSVLMLGPGTNVSHRAMELVGDAGTSLVWVGERGVRYYACGRPLTHTARLVTRQAELSTNVRKRLAVARRMYQMRFPNEDVSGLTMQQLRGREGSRIRSVYRSLSKETGVPWKGREYRPDDFAGGSAINMALSAAHACLYGVTHSVIAALGCSPSLGFVHVGHERSFVYDIADLYKAEITIPIAFQVVARESEDIAADTRRCVRDAFFEGHILERVTIDIHRLLLGPDEVEIPEVNIVRLWDEKGASVAAGRSYDSGYVEDFETAEIGYGAVIGGE